MLDLRALTLSLLALCNGCAGVAATAPSPRLPVRLLSSEAASPPRPEAAPSQSDVPHRDVAVPRIGAPGGSGAGSRRVAPAQSGKETVGGLPVGMAGGTGPRG
jgi:hypothetical protein